jgi:hypothetical protein
MPTCQVNVDHAGEQPSLYGLHFVKTYLARSTQTFLSASGSHRATFCQHATYYTMGVGRWMAAGQ